MPNDRRLAVILMLLMVLVSAIVPTLASPAGAGFITGTVYIDRNVNGQMDAGENGVSGAELTLLRGELEVQNLRSNADGSYSFSSLPDDVYVIRARLPEDHIPTSYLAGGSELIPSGGRTSQTIPLNISSGASLNINLGAMNQTNGSFVRAIAFGDDNLNGGRFSNEPLLRGVQVELLININDQYFAAASGETDREGQVTLPRVAPGTYVLGAAMPEGYIIGPLGSKINLFYNTILPDEGSYGQSEPFTLPESGSLGLGIGGALTGSGKVTVWDDLNFNGIREAGEPGLAGVSVSLKHQTMGVDRSVLSGDDGSVIFPLLQPGDYTLSASLDNDRMFTVSGGNSIFSSDDSRSESRTVSVAAQRENDFGLIGAITNTSLSIHAFHDGNVNGVADADEPVFAGAQLTVYQDGREFFSAQSDTQGLAGVPLLRAGEYELKLRLPDGQIFSIDGGVSGNRFFSDTAASELTIPYTVTPGQDNVVSAGVTLPGMIAGTLFVDTNSNGIWDAGEEMMPGFTVQAIDSLGRVAAQTLTGDDGTFQTPGVIPGAYSLRTLLQSPFIFSGEPTAEAEHRNRFTSQTPEYGQTEPFSVAPGQLVNRVDGAIFRSAVIEGDVLLGDESDGFSGTLGGLSGVFIELLDEDGNPVSDYTVATTDDQGHYLLKGALPALYSLRYTLPEGAAFSRPLSDERSFTSSQFNVGAGAMLDAQPLYAVKTGSYSGRVYIDRNINGRYDEGDEPVSGQIIRMESVIPANTRESVSAEDGLYQLTGLRPGSYSLLVTLPEGMIFSYDEQSPFDPAISGSSNADVAIAMGETAQDRQIAALPAHKLTGRVYYDNNLDSTAQEGEPGLAAGEVRLRHELTRVEFKALTDDKGSFELTTLFPGDYTLSIQLPADHLLYAPAGTQTGGVWESKLTFSPEETESGIGLGLVQFGSIEGSLFNLDGSQESVAGVPVRLLNTKGESVAEAVTGETGSYRFERLYPGEYRMEATLPDGYLFARVIDSDNARFSRITADGGEIEGNRGLSAPFTLNMSENLADQDIGMGAPAQIGDYAWLDLDRDGMQDAGEPGVPGLDIRLTQYGQEVARTQTDAYGRYAIRNIYPGIYTLVITLPPELAATIRQNEFPLVASILPEDDGTELTIENMVISGGGRNLNVDFGLVERQEGIRPASMQNPPQKDWTPYVQVEPKRVR